MPSLRQPKNLKYDLNATAIPSILQAISSLNPTHEASQRPLTGLFHLLGLLLSDNITMCSSFTYISEGAEKIVDIITCPEACSKPWFPYALLTIESLLQLRRFPMKFLVLWIYRTFYQIALNLFQIQALLTALFLVGCFLLCLKRLTLMMSLLWPLFVDFWYFLLEIILKLLK